MQDKLLPWWRYGDFSRNAGFPNGGREFIITLSEIGGNYFRFKIDSIRTIYCMVPDDSLE